MSNQISIAGSAPGLIYTLDNSQIQGARVCGGYESLRLAERSTLNLADQLAFDAGATYVVPAPGTP